MVTLMMTDLRGFTSICERLDPKQVMAVINNYLGIMTNIILKYDGSINEFIGDAIMAIFGAPLEYKNHAEKAIACAIEMQTAMKEVNEKI
jgi:Adenylate cyclase, family 3 (some proteins contain HAMP domain)